MTCRRCRTPMTEQCKTKHEIMISHYLVFNGNCADAPEVYAEPFGGKILDPSKYGDLPPNPDFPVAEEDKNPVRNSRLEIGGMEIMCADSAA